jgi:iron complex outermembrane receptor protein
MYNAGCLFHYKKVNAGIYYHFAEKEYGSDDNSDRETGVYGAHDEMSLLDAKISYQLIKNMSISLSINNILDKEYYVYYKAPGRTFTINLSAKF